MKKLLALVLLFIPSLSFADRLGSLRSAADVLLTTQTVNITTVNSSFTVNGVNGELVKYQLNAGSMTGAGLTNCGDATHAVNWNSSTNLFGCQSIAGSAGGGTVNMVGVGTGSVTGYTGAITSSSTVSQIVLFDSGTLTSRFIGGTTVFIGLNLSATQPILYNSATGVFSATPISLSTGVTGSLPAASIAAGSLGTGVIASSLSVNSVYPSAVTSGVYGNITGVGSQSQALNMGTQLINNVVDPVSAQDTATKNYVDTNVNSLYWKQSARLGTTAALPANTYNNGASGVGATLTEIGFGALAIDGVTPSLSDRVLVKNEVTTANNGIYSVTALGSVAAAYVLTRTLDYNQSSEVQAGDSLFITSGTTQADSGWIQITTGTITMGSSPIVFNQFTGLGQITAGYGLTTSGNVITLLSNTTSYLQNRSTLQSGTTAYPDFLYVGSSGTIANPTFTGTNLSMGTPLSLDASNVLVSSSGANLYTYTSSGTFTFQKPNWAHALRVKVCGGGGGGGGGEGQVSSTQKAGGSAGGGGACHEETLWTTDIANSVTVIVGSGGVVGTGGTNGVGTSGGTGSYSVFGSILAAYGGGPGLAPSATSTCGGGGGSWETPGLIGSTGVQGASCNFIVANAPGGAGCGGTSAGGGIGKGAQYGGGSGGGTITVGAGNVGGNSAHGGSGGGGAGGVSSGNSAAAGAAAGGVGINLGQSINLNGGAGGSAAGSSGASCTAGVLGSSGTFSLGGMGGGAGGANSVGNGCSGGNGGACGGGGGGGGAGTNVGGNGGAGGIGCVYILAF